MGRDGSRSLHIRRATAAGQKRDSISKNATASGLRERRTPVKRIAQRCGFGSEETRPIAAVIEARRIPRPGSSGFVRFRLHFHMDPKLEVGFHIPVEDRGLLAALGEISLLHGYIDQLTAPKLTLGRI